MPILPRLLVINDMTSQRADACTVLTAAGWTVDEAAAAAVPQAIAAHRYALILLDIDSAGLTTARAIRQEGSADRNVPIVALTSTADIIFEAEMREADIDGHIEIPVPAARLATLVAAWWPDLDTPGRRRLAELFGAPELASLTARFAGQLAEALAEIDAPGGRNRAHRIAGLAGTLGFVEAYDTWLALSEGRPGARHPAAVAARRTLRGIVA